jgi:large subunit ribosomal protein L9
MKVVLLKDVKNMGKAGSVIDVSDGHATNLLIPRKLAVLATPGAIQKATSAASQEGAKRDLEKKLIEDRISALSEERTVITKKANEQGHLYDAVDGKDVAAATKLPEEAIRLEKPIKEIGTFDVPVAYGNDFGKISIVIEAE